MASRKVRLLNSSQDTYYPETQVAAVVGLDEEITAINDNFTQVAASIKTVDDKVNAIQIPTVPTYTGGTGINVTSGFVINHSNSITASNAGPSTNATLTFGGTFVIPQLVWDAQGHLTTVTARTMTMPANPNTNTTYTAGTGLALSGTTFNHSNAITAGSVGPSTNATLAFGGTFTVPQVTYDAQGHISAVATRTLTMPAAPTTISGNAGSATKLATARAISSTGDVTWSTSFDGSAAATGTATLAASGVTAAAYGPTANATLAYGGTFLVPQITFDAKGRATTAAARTFTMPAAPTSVSGNAGTATKLAVARSISSTGDVTWTTSFDGSANATGTATLANTAVTAGTYGPTANSSPGYGGTFTVPGSVIVDAKGRLTGITNRTITMPAAQTIPTIPTIDSGTATVYLGSGSVTANWYQIGKIKTATFSGSLTIPNTGILQDSMTWQALGFDDVENVQLTVQGPDSSSFYSQQNYMYSALIGYPGAIGADYIVKVSSAFGSTLAILLHVTVTGTMP